MRVGVLGATGFLGPHVLRTLTAAGHQAVGLSRRGTPAQPVANVTYRACDGLCPDPEALEGLDAVINLVGIKMANRKQSFEQAHVTVVLELAKAMKNAGVGRLVHISVAGLRPEKGDEYLNTKVRGEAAIKQTEGDGVRWTIVRPGVVYGEGDDVIRNLGASIRHLPIFPAVDGGDSSLQLVDVLDVAEGVVAALGEKHVGKTIDIIGPKVVTLRELISCVAEALELCTVAIPVPASVLKPVAGVLESFMTDPPVTRTQLALLSRGVVGDVDQTRALLEREPSPLSVARVRQIDKSTSGRPLFGVSLRPLFLPCTIACNWKRRAML